MRGEYAKEDIKLKNNSINIIAHRTRHNKHVAPSDS
jgi:hypothetical protein